MSPAYPPGYLCISVPILLLLIAGAVLYGRYKLEIREAYRRTTGCGKLIQTTRGAIQYAEWGDGPPVLIIHGAGGGCDQGIYFARLIGGPFRWIAPSRFGFLGSPVPAGASSEDQADAYAALLEALSIDAVGVVGVSMGGPSSLLFAQRYPQRCRCLAEISATSHAIPSRPAALAALFDLFTNDFIFWLLARGWPQGLLAALGVPGSVQKSLSGEEKGELRAFLRSIEPMAARRQGQRLEQHMSEIDPGKIEAITVPTLVLHAHDDTLVDFEHAEHSAAAIPGAQLIPMRRGGHLALMLDQNRESRQQLLRFLQMVLS